MEPGPAASTLGVTTTTVLAWAHDGWIRHCRDGARVAYASTDVKALAELLAGHRRPTIRLIRALKGAD